MARRPDAFTLLAFAGFVLLAGANGTAIALSSRDLAPFWGGALRFLAAGAIFLGVALMGKRAFPTGRALVGVVLYGAIGFFGTFAFINWALQSVRPGLLQVVLASIPLVTLLLAVGERQERFRPLALAGGLVSFSGIAFIFRAQLSAAVPVAGLLAVCGASFCMAQGSILAKRFPKADVMTTNAIAMSVAGALFLALSIATSEPHKLPTSRTAWLAMSYLVILGSVAAFLLYLVVLQRWTASAAAFQWVMLPLVAVPLSAYLTGEDVTTTLLAGGALVLAGVYVGVLWKPRQTAPAVDVEPVPSRRK